VARDSYFRVGFDGKWQKDFDFEADAMKWAREVSLTGQTACVIEQRGSHALFRAGFAAREAEENHTRGELTAFPAELQGEEPESAGIVGIVASAMPCRRTLRFWGRFLRGALRLIPIRNDLSLRRQSD
jgi:hypothetical protein